MCSHCGIHNTCICVTFKILDYAYSSLIQDTYVILIFKINNLDLLTPLSYVILSLWRTRIIVHILPT